ncbi:MAG TPA: VWA domain-containing protein [Thermoanaerobaculia bacterium]|nr:VWA domain-containing protein [Thermoanaerobaculia bacterium]
MTSKLAENVIHFTRLLRGAGLPLGPASALDALAAASAVDVLRRAELYWALHAVLVKRPEDREVFDQAFRLFWRDPAGANAALAALAETTELLPRLRLPPAPAAARRIAEAWQRPRGGPQAKEASERGELDAALTFSADEVLRQRDFEQMSADELARAKLMVARMTLGLRPVRTRRFAPDPHGAHLDLARTARESRKTLGDLAPLRFRTRILLPPPLVVLCDISGSMGRYSEMLLHFLHALLGARTRVHAFVFATRLTPVTRLLRRRDPDEALARCGRQVADWAGGTRLGACLREFNRSWSRRVAHGAVVLLITDGLDRDPGPGLAAEADRLHRSCRRLVWLNPLLRWAGFQPRALGVRALLPHVDEHRPVHNLDSLEALGRALGARAGGRASGGLLAATVATAAAAQSDCSAGSLPP